MKNGDLFFFFLLALAVAAMYAMMKKYPSNPVQGTQSPLPSGMYTSGSLVNGMDVSRRVNFQQQPVGGPTTG